MKYDLQNINELILIVCTIGMLCLALFSFLLKILNDIKKDLKEINSKITSKEIIEYMIEAHIHQHTQDCKKRMLK